MFSLLEQLIFTAGIIYFYYWNNRFLLLKQFIIIIGTIESYLVKYLFIKTEHSQKVEF